MRILFLEDRPSRQKQFLPNKEKDVEKLENMTAVFMPKSEVAKEVISQINEGTYSFDEGLQLIIVHTSALEPQGLAYINQFCNKKNANLVCFSGGTSQLTYNHDGYEFININSADFYTERLIPFLENVVAEESETLLELTSQDWKLSYLFLARQIMGSIKLESGSDAEFEFQERLDQILNRLNLELSSDENERQKEIDKEIKKRILTL